MCLVRADVCTEVSRCLLSCHRNIANLIIRSLIVTRVSYLVWPIFLVSVSPGICSLAGNDSHILSPHSSDCGHVVRLYSNLCHRCVIVWAGMRDSSIPHLPYPGEALESVLTKRYFTFIKKSRKDRGNTYLDEGNQDRGTAKNLSRLE